MSEKETKFPKFLNNHPNGKDLYKGKSQEKLSKAISTYIEDVDSDNENTISKVIGIEGGWGVGKSNVIKQIKKTLSSEYYLFEYDAWGHQEDLQRRSFLESLTKELIEKEVLVGETTLRRKTSDEEEQVLWSKKLEYLFARKKETNKLEYPTLNEGAIVATAVVVLTPILTFVGYVVSKYFGWIGAVIGVVLAALPVILAFFQWYRSCKKDNVKMSLSYFLAIYKDEITSNVTYETISEEEPSVIDFRQWMQDISNHIKKEKKKIIIVYDNMDRLPSSKVRTLWSSIHTFFSDGGFDNIWTIIPYDRRNLSNVFSSESQGDTERLTNHFIDKTFPIRFRVAPPVIEDYKDIFTMLFQDAFGTKAKEPIVNRVFRKANPEATIRETIVFLNKLVALKRIWKDEIDIIPMAVYTVCEDMLEQDVVNQILSGDYLKEASISKIITNDDAFQSNISALYYGISVDNAKQIPIRKLIQQSVKNKSSWKINSYVGENPYVFSILDDLVNDIEVEDIDLYILALNELDLEKEGVSAKDKETMSQLWKHLSRKKTNMPLETLTLPKEYEILIKKLNKTEVERVIASVYSKCFGFKELEGSDFYKILFSLEKLVTEINLDVSIPYKEKKLTPAQMIGFVSLAKKEFVKYQVVCEESDLDAYYASLLPDSLQYTEFIPCFLDNGYQFPSLKQTIETVIVGENITNNNVELILELRKILTSELPFTTALSNKMINGLLVEQINNDKNKAYFDLIAMHIASADTTVLYSDLTNYDVIEVADRIENYTTQKELLELVNSTSNRFLPMVLKELITRNSTDEFFPISHYIKEFDSYVTKLEIDKITLFKYLNDRWSNTSEDMSIENIQTLIPNPVFYSITVKNEESLAAEINKQVCHSLRAVSSDTLYTQKNSSTSFYWFQVTDTFIDTNLLSPFPENLSDFGKKILMDIGNQVQNLPLPELTSKIIGKIESSKIVPTIKDIVALYTNKTKNMTPTIFKFFCKWFVKEGELYESKRSAHTILLPILGDPDCLTLILNNAKYFEKVITMGGNDSSEVITKIATMTEASPSNDKLKSFAIQIGAYKEVVIEVEDESGKKKLL